MNTPDIRFKGFTDAWEQRKLKDITDRVTRKNEKLESDLPLTISAQYGLIDQNEFFDKRIASKDISGYYLLKKGEFAYNKSTSADAPWGAIKRLDLYEMGVLSTLYIVFAIKNSNVDSDYLASYYNTDNWHKQVSECAAEGARNHGLLNISAEDFLNTKLFLPTSKSEQELVGMYLKQLDNLIALNQRKLDTLKNYKKAMLVKMFPREGQKVPEIRFKGFTGDWEQRKFRDVGLVSMCKRIFKEETSSEGDVPFFKIGTFGSEPDAYISRNLFEEYKTKFPFPSVGDILLSASGTIGRIVEYNGEDAYFQDSNIVWLSHDNTICNKFLKVLYPTIRWDGIEGSTIKRLYNDNFLRTQFQMPELDEQEVIGNFFGRLDNLITLHQRKLDKLKDLKQAMLDKMFVKGGN